MRRGGIIMMLRMMIILWCARRLVELIGQEHGTLLGGSAAVRVLDERGRYDRGVVIIVHCVRQMHGLVLLCQVLHGARSGRVNWIVGCWRWRRRICRCCVKNDRLVVVVAIVNSSIIAVCVGHRRQSSVGWLFYSFKRRETLVIVSLS